MKWESGCSSSGSPAVLTRRLWLPRSGLLPVYCLTSLHAEVSAMWVFAEVGLPVGRCSRAHHR